MLKKTLVRIDDSGRPLYAYLLAQQLSDSEEGYESWTRIDLLNNQLVRDKIRWEHAFRGDVPTWGDAHPAMKLVVLATIVREIKFQDDPITKHFGSIDSSLRREAVAIARGYLINSDNRPAEIHALEPDLLGEWFVLYCFHQGFEFEELLNIAWQYSPDKVADFLQRITQDFIDLPKKDSNGNLVEELLAHAPPHESHYQALGNTAPVIAHKLYQRNLPLPQNIIIALEHAANLSNVAAMNYLGFLYHQGIGVIRNAERAVSLYQRSVEQGDSAAIFNLSVCYHRGEGVEQDWNKAAELYQQAVEQGNREAMFNLGVCYEKGEGVGQDWSKAVDLYQRAIEQGDSAAMFNLGVCYDNGTGVEQDWSKAFALYQRAVEQGESRAMTTLGICYQNGENVEQDWSKAVDLYQRAVEQGNSTAMTSLGVCYENGEGVEQDLSKAVDLYQRAVEQGDSAAMINLGVCYDNGEGVEQDLNKAVDLYQRAVNQSNSEAMINLGLCYQNGDGVEQDWNKAVELYQQAVKAGENRAIISIQNVLLHNFLGAGNYNSNKINGLLNGKLLHLKEAPVFDPPMLGGNWSQLTFEELTAYIDRVTASFEILELTERLNGYVSQYARLLPLKFYKNCNLLDIQLYNCQRRFKTDPFWFKNAEVKLTPLDLQVIPLSSSLFVSFLLFACS
jgi:TPR repeat protein